MASFFAMNTRGFNDTRKHVPFRNWLSSFSSTPLFGCLLETKILEANSQRILHSVFRDWQLITNYEHHHLGRIWLVFSRLVQLTVLHKSAQSVSVLVVSATHGSFVISCIYAFNTASERVALWSDLRAIHHHVSVLQLPWISVGDFNVTLAAHEHSRIMDYVVDQSGMRDFQELVHDCSIHDLTSSGTKFTWWNHREADPIAKKLDRVMINEKWLDHFPHSYTHFAVSGISDHALSVTFLSRDIQVHRKPFRLFNFVFEHPDFVQSITEAWSSLPPLFHSRSALSRLHVKLRTLKPILKHLNKSRYGDISLKSKEAYEELLAAQTEALSHPSEAAFQAERHAAANWSHYAGVEEQFYQQKSRVQWLGCGDHNTTFFHNMVKTRNSRNSIVSLNSRAGDTLTTPEAIAQEAVSFYQALYTSPGCSTDFPLRLDQLIKYRCSSSMADILVRPVTAEEIRKVLFDMPKNKASGPDGFTSEFFQHTWGITGSDLVVAVQSFFYFGFLPRGINSTTLALIPKTDPPDTIRDFRPISCCNMIYKIISGILASRLKLILPHAIEPNQSAFVKGRLLLENVLLATELVKDYHKPGITPRCALKLDIAKAFDTLNWSFLLDALRAMGLPDLFISWISSCLSSASFSVMLNGELHGFFSSSRGIRQGCSLSPYLFDIAINVLSLMLNKAAASGHFGYHSSCESIGLTHLSFADDLMIFFDGSRSSLQGIKNILHIFSSVSGLNINVGKSSLFMAGRIAPDFQQAASASGFPLAALPIRYLGLPLTTKTLTRADYDPLLDRIRSRFLSWTHRSLSYAGRLQLIKSVITSITNFWLGAFRLPCQCTDEIERMCAAFLWSGTPNSAAGAKVSWEDVCKPKNEGGLGIRKIRDTSLVFSLHLIWRLLTTSGSLWVAWINHYVLDHTSFWDFKVNSKGSWIWKKLLHLRPLAANFFKKEIRDGKSTFFWHDTWIGSGRLWDSTPGTSSWYIGIHRNARVCDAADQTGWNLRSARSAPLQHVLSSVQSTRPPSPSLGPDLSLWKSGEDTYSKTFSAHKTWNLIRQSSPVLPWTKLIWFNYGIPRYSFITWLAFLDRLSTGVRMRLWGGQQLCVFCGDPDETKDHLFFGCPFSFQLWSLLARDLIGPTISPAWNYTVAALLGNRKPRLDNILLKLVFQSAVYYIWKERNSRIHSTTRQSFYAVAAQIASTIRNRILSRQSARPEDTNGLLARWDSAWARRSLV